MTAVSGREAVAESAIARELELVRQAVAMVASGGSRRVVVSNLRFGAELLPMARALASANGLRIVPIWRADDSGPDIQVVGTDPA
jgi:hypothetical protein